MFNFCDVRFKCVGIYDDYWYEKGYDDYCKQKMNYEKLFIPEIDKCSECGTEISENGLNLHEAQLYTMDYGRFIVLGEWTCPSEGCGAHYCYDGYNDHICNIDNKYLVEHEFFNEFTERIHQESKLSFRAFYGEAEARYEANGSHFNLMPRGKFELYWRSFIVIQKWPFANICIFCDRGLIFDKKTMTLKLAPNSTGPTGEVPYLGMCLFLFFFFMLVFFFCSFLSLSFVFFCFFVVCI